MKLLLLTLCLSSLVYYSTSTNALGEVEIRECGKSLAYAIEVICNGPSGPAERKFAHTDTMKLLLLTLCLSLLVYYSSTSSSSAINALVDEQAIRECGKSLFQALDVVCNGTSGLSNTDIHFEASGGVYISNLNEACMRCLCHVAGCNTSHACSGGYCGPFYISRVYWVDAGKPTLPDDDPGREQAFEDCARDYHCSIKIIEGYMAKFGKDCNGDGVTNCFDYMMINHHGGGACHFPLETDPLGRRRLALFSQCRL